MTGTDRGDGELLTVGREFVANGGDQFSIFHLSHFRLPLIDLVDFNLIEAEISGCGRGMSVRFGGEIKVRFAGHHNVQLVLHGSDGKFIGRIKRGLRGDQRPGANARILLRDEGESGSESEKSECTNCSGEMDGINVADCVAAEAEMHGTASVREPAYPFSVA